MALSPSVVAQTTIWSYSPILGCQTIGLGPTKMPLMFGKKNGRLPTHTSIFDKNTADYNLYPNFEISDSKYLINT